MIPLGRRPVISHIIDSYPADTEFVIALGYQGSYIEQYLDLAYPKLIKKYVSIDRYRGPGSGLGYTLKKCLEYIDDEFVFHANDSIVTDRNLRFPMNSDTMLLSAGPADPKTYRTVSFNKSDGMVTKIHDKTDRRLKQVNNYIGVAFIKDFQRFVHYLGQMSVEIGETAYFMRYVGEDITTYIVDQWHDVGTLEQLREAERDLSDFDNLMKPGEAIYFNDNRVLKFNVDKEFIRKREKRANLLKGLVPEITNSLENFYTYNYVPGVLLSEEISLERIFEGLLSWLQINLWKPKRLSAKSESKFQDSCFSFYYEKTTDRINEFFQQYNIRDQEETINGVTVPALASMLDRLDWSQIKSGVPVQFHGDLHFENILKSGSKFTLLDWRQDFAGSLTVGDIYYDLAKLLHGLIVNHAIIRQSLYTVEVNESIVQFDFHRRNTLVNCEQILRDFVDISGYSWERVNQVTALVFLNIAPLHHHPYSHLLYYLGKSMLFSCLGEQNSKPINGNNET